jgi:hypothetical protein
MGLGSRRMDSRREDTGSSRRPPYNVWLTTDDGASWKKVSDTTTTGARR